MNTKSLRLNCLIAASLGLLGGCSSGDINFPDVGWPVNPSGPAGVIQFTDVSYEVTEGEIANIRVSRSGGSSGWVSVGYACIDGSAVGGSDFTAVTGRLSWPSGGSGSRTISIRISDDKEAESSESFTVTLSNVSGAILGADSTATVNIADNDSAAVKISGSVTSLDNMMIDGIRYNIDAATISVNRSPATATDLKLGQFVGLEGDVNFSDAAGTARDISYLSLVIGPVAGVNAAKRRLLVVGQTILIGERTVFDPSIDPDTFAGLSIGASAQISGFHNNQGDIVATRIEPGMSSKSVQLIGTVAMLDLANMLFTVNGLTVDYGDASLIDLPTGMPETGQLVLVRGSMSNGVLVVDEIIDAEKEV